MVLPAYGSSSAFAGSPVIGFQIKTRQKESALFVHLVPLLFGPRVCTLPKKEATS